MNLSRLINNYGLLLLLIGKFIKHLICPLKGYLDRISLFQFMSPTKRGASTRRGGAVARAGSAKILRTT